MNSANLNFESKTNEMDIEKLINMDWASMAKSLDTLRETEICSTDYFDELNKNKNKISRIEEEDPLMKDLMIEKNLSDNINTNSYPLELRNSNNKAEARKSYPMISSGRYSPYDNVEYFDDFSNSTHMKDQMGCDDRIDQILASSMDDSLDRFTSSNCASSEILFEKLTNEVVSALTEGLEYDKWSRENLIDEKLSKNENKKKIEDCNNFTNENKDADDTTSSVDDNVKRVERLRTLADREKALQWALRLDRLISESSCRHKHPIWGSSVDGEEFCINEQETVNTTELRKSRDKCLSELFGEKEEIMKNKGQIRTSMCDTNFRENFREEETISTEPMIEYPSVQYEPGLTCETIEDAQDILATKYTLRLKLTNEMECSSSSIPGDELHEIAIKKAIITWSRWNILDLIRSPSGESDVWAPNVEPSQQLSNLLADMRELNEEIEKREQVIAGLILAKTENNQIDEDTLDTNETPHIARTVEKEERLQANKISSSTGQGTACEGENSRNKPFSAPARRVNRIQAVHRWIRFLIQSLSRHRSHRIRR